MHNCKDIQVTINQSVFHFDSPNQTGRSIKEAAAIPLCDTLIRKNSKEHSSHDKHHEIIDNDDEIVLENGEKFRSKKAQEHIEVTINRVKYCFDSPCQTGKSLKERAGIELTDVLFRHMDVEDEVIPNDASIKLHCGDRFYSSPPANYGERNFVPEDVGHHMYECIDQPGGWTFLVISNFEVPPGFSHNKAQVLIKLPPGFPDAAPDMFWVTPHLSTAQGKAPQGTSFESLLGQQWQRFSWHLKPGAWRPGVSTLRDFMRCIHARFQTNQ